MHDDLLRHARFLLTIDPESPEQVNLRRAISGAYYAVFHLLAHEMSAAILPAGPHAVYRARLIRALSHDELRIVATAIWKGEELPLLKVVKAPDELKDVAKAAYELQLARHLADYDAS